MSVSFSSPSEMFPSSSPSTEKSLLELLNLSLRTPEVGAVNFNTLYTLLHAMLQQLQLQNTTTEVLTDHLPSNVIIGTSQDFDEEKDQEGRSTSAKSRGSEYSDHGQSVADSRPSTQMRFSPSVEKLNKKVSDMEEKLKYLKSELGERPGIDSNVQDLKRKVSNMENQLEVLNTMPTTKDIISQSRSTSSMHPATDVWQHLQLQRKVATNESGVSRALSLLDELMKLMNAMKDKNNDMQAEIDQLKEKSENAADLDDICSRLEHVETFEEKIDDLRTDLDELADKLKQYPDPSEFENFITWQVLQEALSQHMVKMGDLQKQIASMRPSLTTDTLPDVGGPGSTESDAYAPSSPDSSRPQSSDKMNSDKLNSAKMRFPQATDMLEKIGALNDKHSELDHRVCSLEDILPKKQDRIDMDDFMKGMSKTEGLPEDLIEQLEKLKRAICILEKEKDRLEEQVKLQQESIDALLSMPKQTYGGESSGYESAGGPGAVSTVDIRKLELAIQRMGQKFSNDIKHLQEADTELGNENKELQRAIEDIYKQIKEMRITIQMLKDRQKSLSAQMERNKYSDESLKLTPKDSLDLISVSKAPDHPPSPPSSSDGIDGSTVLRPPMRKMHKLQDAEQITNMQNSLLNLEAELEKLTKMVIAAMDEHEVKQKHIDALYGYVEKLEDLKADKEAVKKEMDLKADKKALATKVNRTDFDSTVYAMTKSLDDITARLLTMENDWQASNKHLSAEIETKLDRIELENLKNQFDHRLKAFKKLLEQRPSKEGFAEDDAAGFRKQLIQSYNCISCDRPVDMAPAGPVPSIPANASLPYTKSVRPYTSFELDQIRHQTKGAIPGKNAANFKAALEEREVARLRKLEELAFRTHFPPQGTYPPPEEVIQHHMPVISGEESESTDTVMPSGRPCGGNYTLTYPHRRYTRLTHLSELWQEEEAMMDVTKEEVELQGHNGQIYRGRLATVPVLHQSRPPPAGAESTYGPDQSGTTPRPNSARISSQTYSTNIRPSSSGNIQPHPPDHSPGPHASPEHSNTRVSGQSNLE